MGRRDHAHVHGERLHAADPLEAALLEHAQHLGLRVGRHVADLVQEDGAAVRGLEAADAARVRARERALLVAEQLALDQLAADRRAVHRHEGAALPRARLVQRLRHQLLAGARLAADQHGEVGLRDLPDRLEHRAHARPAAHQVPHAELALDARAQQAVLARELRALERAPDDQADLVVVEGLRDVVLGAELHRLDRDLLAAVRGDHHDRRLGLALARAAHHVEAGGAVAEREVGQHEVELAALELGERIRAALALHHLVALAAEQAGERQPDARLVLHHQHARRAHRGSPDGPERGRVITNSVPSPGAEPASIAPPCASITFLLSARPRPVPVAFEV